MNTQIFSVSGITCEACVKVITRRIGRIPGVSSVKVSESGETFVTSQKQIDKDAVKKALSETQYTVL